MGRYAYLAPFFLFVPAFLAMVVGGSWTWFLPVFTFVVLPIAEQVWSGTKANATGAEEAALASDRWYDVILWLVVPAQWSLLLAFLWRLQHGGFSAWEVGGAVFTMGIACATYGINVAHELGHRRSRFEQDLSKALLMTSLYLHFFVEHNRGHHRRVATPEDPASARRGETLYGFWWRSVTGSYRSAWHLENARLAQTGTPWWSWTNEMVRFTVAQAAMLLAIAVVFGPVALAGFVAAGAGGFLLLETVNYVEHYGLARQRNDKGVYERVQPHHSWNSNRPGGRMFLFDLTRHSDHHANATRKYQVLRHFDDAPELPAGYPAMILLALCPPLFQAVMERALRRWDGRQPEPGGVLSPLL